MARKLSPSEHRYDPWGQDTWTHPDEEQYREEMAERDYAPYTHCLTCGKPLEARLTCVACGDDERQVA